jgi:hypothetical protein
LTLALALLTLKFQCFRQSILRSRYQRGNPKVCSRAPIEQRVTTRNWNLSI